MGASVESSSLAGERDWNHALRASERRHQCDLRPHRGRFGCFGRLGCVSGQLDTVVGKRSFASRQQEVRPGEAKGFSVVTVAAPSHPPVDPCPGGAPGARCRQRGCALGRRFCRPHVGQRQAVRPRRRHPGRRWRRLRSRSGEGSERPAAGVGGRSPARAVPGGDGRSGPGSGGLSSIGPGIDPGVPASWPRRSEPAGGPDRSSIWVLRDAGRAVPR